MRRNHVQAGRKTEPNAADKRIRETHASQVDVRVPPQERAHIVLRSEELAGRIVEWNSRARPNALMRLLF